MFIHDKIGKKKWLQLYWSLGIFTVEIENFNFYLENLKWRQLQNTQIWSDFQIKGQFRHKLGAHKF
jgi:hypothetical protein